jgi:hypothetical protein
MDFNTLSAGVAQHPDSVATAVALRSHAIWFLEPPSWTKTYRTWLFQSDTGTKSNLKGDFYAIYQ